MERRRIPQESSASGLQVVAIDVPASQPGANQHAKLVRQPAVADRNAPLRRSQPNVALCVKVVEMEGSNRRCNPLGSNLTIQTTSVDSDHDDRAVSTSASCCQLNIGISSFCRDEAERNFIVEESESSKTLDDPFVLEKLHLRSFLFGNLHFRSSCCHEALT